MRLFDSHCHLQDKRIVSDIEPILERAKAAGVEFFVCCGCSEQDWDDVINLCEKYKCLIPAFGVHPWYTGGRSENWIHRLESVLKEYPQAAIGEIGLDHLIENRNDQDQINVFNEQLILAEKLDRPVSIHCRKAWGDLFNTLIKRKLQGVIHSYSGSAQLVSQLQRSGFYLSYSGSVTYKNNHKITESLKKMDHSRLLIESDSPDIKPSGVEGYNEPANLILTVNKIAEILNLDRNYISELTYQNGIRLFRR